MSRASDNSIASPAGEESRGAMAMLDLLPQPLLRPLVARICQNDADSYRRAGHQRPGARLSDFIFVTPDRPCSPQAIFPRLRWGGLLAFASPNRRQAEDLARQYAEDGFQLEEGPSTIRRHFLGLPIPLFCRKLYYFLARRVLLIPPGQITQRFTHQVQIVHNDDPEHPLAVLKEVPSFGSIASRLEKKFPDLPPELIQRRARNFTERIIPTFLTREAAFLELLQERLPEPYRRRVPRPLAVEKDEQGLVRRLRMTWLRNGGRPLSQLEFALQSADLLRALHDIAHIIHLDLRLDNFVITENGVGFVDFGSAVRDDEDLSGNPLLSTLFDDLMRTSQIQRMLYQMTLSGHVTSDVIRRSHHKVDKAIDFFFLAVQFNCPHSNPDLVDLIQYDPASREARELSHLTTEILRPADPAHPTFRSAQDILHGIEMIRGK